MIADPDPSDPQDIKRWRRDMRAELIATRMAISQAERAAKSDALVSLLSDVLVTQPGKIVSLYWPFRGEPDLRPLAAMVERQGGRAALPVVKTPKAPLVFRPWTPGAAMTRGIWNIPVPETEDEVVPDILLAPLVGFDLQKYRLGYGGGYFDRTLERRGAEAIVIGVGYASQALQTIHPQPHDVPMSRIVTV